MVSIRRPPCNLDLQLGRSLDKSVQDSGVVLKSFRSCFMTSLKLKLWSSSLAATLFKNTMYQQSRDSVIWHAVDVPGPAQADKLEPR